MNTRIVTMALALAKHSLIYTSEAADAMQRVDKAGFDVVMHVHDEIVVELWGGLAERHNLEVICEIMGNTSEVYAGVPFPADGYLTPYYKKD